jgi:type II secretory pathway component PulK
MTRFPQRRGYALLAVLWILVGVGSLVAITSVAARDAITSSHNRIALETARWTAAACQASIRDAIGQAIAESSEEWGRVAEIVQTVPLGAGLTCRTDARAVGARIDINTSDRASLRQAFRLLGMQEGAADSATAAVIARRRIAVFDDVRELLEVEELRDLSQVDSVFDVEPGPVALSHAPPMVLALLPGFTERTVREVIDARERGAPIEGFGVLGTLLSPEEPEAAAEMPALVVFTPSAWTITVRSTTGVPKVTVAIEVRLARTAGVVGPTRWREWIE